MERDKEKQGWFIDSHEGNIKDAYHFIEKLANGGFGIVYLAEHRKTSKYNRNSIKKYSFLLYISENSI